MKELVLNLNNLFGTSWCFFTIQEFSFHTFFFSQHILISLKKKKPSTICATVNRELSKVARGRDWTCRFVPSTVILCQGGGYFPPDLTSSAPCVDIEAPPHRDPLADLFDSGSSLWHSPFTEKQCDCGNSASLGSAHHRAQVHVSAHRDDLCSGSSLCGAAVDLNKWMPVIVSFCATEFVLHKRLTLLALRLPFQVRFHWFAAHLTFSAAVSDPQVGCSWTNGNTFCPDVANDQLSQRFVAKRVDLPDRVGPTSVVRSLTALPNSAASCNRCMRLVFDTCCDR